LRAQRGSVLQEGTPACYVLHYCKVFAADWLGHGAHGLTNRIASEWWVFHNDVVIAGWDSGGAPQGS